MSGLLHLSSKADWTADQLTGYCRSWSATARLLEAEGNGPIKELEQQFMEAAGDTDRKWRIQWPLTIRVGMLPAE